eukprot:INCI3282.2.p1 GENE.INCI3282.2~~INCI3282.2.p1  ORF type:complete len:1277 (+),score=138.16 INCI3282.2:236-4066(+)
MSRIEQPAPSALQGRAAARDVIDLTSCSDSLPSCDNHPVVNLSSQRAPQSLPTDSSTPSSQNVLESCGRACSNGNFFSSPIDFRTFYEMPTCMPGHWERSTSTHDGSVSFADVVRTSPSDIGAAVVSTYSLNIKYFLSFKQAVLPGIPTLVLHGDKSLAHGVTTASCGSAATFQKYCSVQRSGLLQCSFVSANGGVHHTKFLLLLGARGKWLRLAISTANQCGTTSSVNLIWVSPVLHRQQHATVANEVEPAFCQRLAEYLEALDERMTQPDLPGSPVESLASATSTTKRSEGAQHGGLDSPNDVVPPTHEMKKERRTQSLGDLLMAVCEGHQSSCLKVASTEAHFAKKGQSISKLLRCFDFSELDRTGPILITSIPGISEQQLDEPKLPNGQRILRRLTVNHIKVKAADRKVNVHVESDDESHTSSDDGGCRVSDRRHADKPVCTAPTRVRKALCHQPNGHLQVKEALEHFAAVLPTATTDTLVLQPTSVGTGIDYDYFYGQFLASLCPRYSPGSTENRIGKETCAEPTTPRSAEGTAFDGDCVRIIWPSQQHVASCSSEGKDECVPPRGGVDCPLPVLLEQARHDGCPEGRVFSLNHVRRVVSNGIPGASSAALVVAATLGLATAGAILPTFGQKLDSKWGLDARPGAQLVSVTRRNVRSADATLIFGACRTPETLLPLHEAQRQGQPVLVVEWTCLDPDPDAERLRQWLVANKVETLHVAGSRKHWRDHGVFEATKRFLIEGLTEREADVERASESSRQAPILAGPPTGIHEGDTCLEDDMGVWLSPQAFSQMGAEIWRHFTLYDQCAPGRRIMPHLKTYFRLRSNGKHRRSNSCSSNSQGRATQHELVWMMFGSMCLSRGAQGFWACPDHVMRNEDCRCDQPHARKVFCVRNFEMGLLWLPRGDVRRMVIPTSGPEQGARQRVGKFLPDGTVEFPLPYQIPGRSFGSTALPCNALGKKGLTSAQIRDVTLELKIIFQQHNPPKLATLPTIHTHLETGRIQFHTLARWVRAKYRAVLRDPRLTAPQVEDIVQQLAALLADRAPVELCRLNTYAADLRLGKQTFRNMQEWTRRKFTFELTPPAKGIWSEVPMMHIDPINATVSANFPWTLPKIATPPPVTRSAGQPAQVPLVVPLRPGFASHSSSSNGISRETLPMKRKAHRVVSDKNSSQRAAVAETTSTNAHSIVVAAKTLVLDEHPTPLCMTRQQRQARTSQVLKVLDVENVESKTAVTKCLAERHGCDQEKKCPVPDVAAREAMRSEFVAGGCFLISLAL